MAYAALALSYCASAQTAAKSAPAPSAVPTVDQILDRYVNALGGSALLEKQTTRTSMGTIEVPSQNISGTVLIHEKAPNKTLQVVIVSGAVFRQGFDGTIGWTDDPQNGTQEISGPELEEVRRDADFFHPLHLRQLYANLTLTGTAKIDDRDVYTIEGSLPEGSDPDKMYFDAQTGLPVRLVSRRHTADGVALLQEDFLDYRDVDGIKLPFTIVQTGGTSDLTVRISEVHFGVDLEDSEFAKPAAQ